MEEMKNKEMLSEKERAVKDQLEKFKEKLDADKAESEKEHDE